MKSSPNDVAQTPAGMSECTNRRAVRVKRPGGVEGIVGLVRVGDQWLVLRQRRQRRQEQDQRWHRGKGKGRWVGLQWMSAVLVLLYGARANQVMGQRTRRRRRAVHRDGAWYTSRPTLW